MTQFPTPPSAPGAPRIRLRILGMSDLHAHLRAHDYDTGRPLPAAGLTRLASLVRAARAEAPNCLLFDNGDTLQGTALGDWAASGEAAEAPHPMVAALNLLGVDAATPGNHDFNYGLPFLEAALAGAAYPLVCANAVRARGRHPDEDRPLLPAWTILERALADDTGRRHRVRIGVIGAVPPQIMDWDRRILKDRIEMRGICEAVAGHLPALRRAGADLVVMLSHSGLGCDSAGPGQEQAARALAREGGLDAIIAGHSHGLFPGPAPGDGCLHGTPLVLPGFWGSHLGVIDLELGRDAEGRWRPARGRAHLRPVTAETAEDPALLAASETAHRATMGWLGRPVGHAPIRLHSYFSMIAPDPAQEIVAEAQAEGLAGLLAGTPHEGLPVLSATSPFKCGGPAGPDFYTDVPAGPVSLRHVADLYTYPNSLCGVLVTGAGLRDWLERSAAIFEQILPGSRGADLVPPERPGYDFDTIFGASYLIDLAAPPRFDPATGALADPGARRIRDLRVAGRKVADSDRFAVATNNYRTGGGGNFPGIDADALIAESSTGLRELIARRFAEGRAPALPAAPAWRFAAVPGASARLASSPRARSAPADMARLGLADLGDRADGFALFELPLDPPPGFAGRPPAKQAAR